MSASDEANIKLKCWSAVTTHRLLLREFDINDTQGYFELESNEDNARYQDWPPRTMEQSRELVLANIQSSCANPRKIWELVVERDGSMIGRVGASLSRLGDADRPRPLNHLDLWFSFLPSLQGRGFAIEAMTAFIDEMMKRQDCGDVELEIECDPRNTGSLKLAERLGFKKYSLTEKAYESKGKWVDSLVYRKTVMRWEVL